MFSSLPHPSCRAAGVALAIVAVIGVTTRCTPLANQEGHGRLRWDSRPDESIALMKDERTLWRFHYGAGENQPFFHPLALPEGPVLTWNRPPDHVWHHGLWFCWKYINGVNYWEHQNDAAKPAGRTSWANVKVDPADDFSARISLDLSYHPAGGDVVLGERRTIAISSPDAQESYRIDWSSVFTSRADRVVLDRTPLPGEPGGRAWGGYAGLSVRLVNLDDRRLVAVDGPVEFNAQNRHRSKTPAMDYSGVIDGATVGIAVCGHPDNLNTPSPWYAIRSPAMTFFTPAVLCYGRHEMRRADSFSLRYRVVVHRGRWDGKRLREEIERFAGRAGHRAPR